MNLGLGPACGLWPIKSQGKARTKGIARIHDCTAAVGRSHHLTPGGEAVSPEPYLLFEATPSFAVTGIILDGGIKLKIF